jgi:hypothetical protein
MISKRLDLWMVPHRRTVRPRRGQTASGYGRRMPSDLMVFYRQRWRRVYVACFGNAGTAYIEDKDGNWIVVEI